MASWPLLECTLKGMKLQQAKRRASRPQSRLPITPGILIQLKTSCDTSSQDPDNMMLWAVCCMCFFGFLRSGEVTVPSAREYDPGGPLSEGDVALDSLVAPTTVQVCIKSSKTDPFRRSVGLVGEDGKELCPVAAIAAYMVIRGRAAGPFFRFASGSPLSRVQFVRRFEAVRCGCVKIFRA